MNYNPYAAPQAGPPPMMGAPPGGPPQGGAQPWDIGEILSLAMDGFKRTWGVLVGAFVVDAILAAIPGQFPNILLQTGSVDPGSVAATIITLVFTFVGMAVGAFMASGLIKINVTAARGGQPNFGDLFSGGSKMFSILATQILMGIAILLGFILLIVPGIILALGLSYSTYFVADADMGPIDAMKASWAATNGSKGKLFLFAIVCFFIALLGFVACCVGVFAATALIALAQAMIYVRLSGRGQTSGGFDPNAGGPGMGGGYGGPPQGGGYGGPPQGGGYGGPPQGGGYGGPPQGGGGYGPPGGGGGYGGPPQGGGGMPPAGGGGYGGPPGYGPPGGGGGAPPGGGGYGGGGGPPGY